LCEAIWKNLSIRILEKTATSNFSAGFINEAQLHANFAKEQIRFFTGRELILNQIDNYLQNPQSKVLVLHGQSGVGKTALTAKAASQAPASSTFLRFIGLTTESSRSQDLLTNLCEMLAEYFQLSPEEAVLPVNDYSELLQTFKERLGLATNKKPIHIFLDALDQLIDQEGRNFGWLPKRLPEHVTLVVSVLNNDMMATLQEVMPASIFIPVPAMSEKHGASLIKQWLAHSSRTLSKEQEDGLRGAFSKNGLPLFLRLAVTEAARWHSYDPLPPLPTTVPKLIKVVLDRLGDNVHHGRAIVECATELLTVSRSGLSDDEIITALWKDEIVHQDFLDRHPKSPKDVDQLPDVIWARLYYDLEPYLAERPGTDKDLLGFYYKQVADYVHKNIEASGKLQTRHLQMARLFETIAHSPEKSGAAWAESPGRVLNELAFHLLKGADRESLQTLYEDPDYIQAMCANFGTPNQAGVYPGISELLLNLNDAVEAYEGTPVAGQWATLKKLLSERSAMLARFPSATKQEIANYLALESNRPYSPELYANANQNKDMGLYLINHPASSFSASGHSAPISALAASPDEETFMSGALDGSVGFWRFDIDEPIWLVNAHQSWVTDVCISEDGKKALSCSDDADVYLWDLKLGIRQFVLQKPTGEQFTNCAFQDKHTAVIIGSRHIYLVDLRSLQFEKQYAGQGGIVKPFCFGLDAQEVAPSQTRFYYIYGNEIRVHDWKTQTQLVSWEHPSGIDFISKSPDRQHLLVADAQKYLTLYDLTDEPKILSRISLPIRKIAVGPRDKWFAVSYDYFLINIEVEPNGQLHYQYSGRKFNQQYNTVSEWDMENPPSKLLYLVQKEKLLVGTYSGEISLRPPISQVKDEKVWKATSNFVKGAIAPGGDTSMAISAEYRTNQNHYGGKLIHIQSDGTVTPLEETPHRQPITGITYVPVRKGRKKTVFTIDKGGKVVRWENGRSVWEKKYPNTVFTALTTSGKKGQPVAGTQNDTLILLDKGKVFSVSPTHLRFKSGVTAVASSENPQGFFTAFRSGEISFHEGQRFWSESVLNRHDYYAIAVALNDKCTRAACGTLSGDIVIWDVDTQERIIQRPVHAGPITGLAFDQESKKLVSISRDKTVYVLDLENDTILEGTTLPGIPTTMRLENEQITILLSNASFFRFQLTDNPITPIHKKLLSSIKK
jgi:WD40 repeat protein